MLLPMFSSTTLTQSMSGVKDVEGWLSNKIKWLKLPAMAKMLMLEGKQGNSSLVQRKKLSRQPMMHGSSRRHDCRNQTSVWEMSFWSAWRLLTSKLLQKQSNSQYDLPLDVYWGNLLLQLEALVPLTDSSLKRGTGYVREDRAAFESHGYWMLPQ